MTLDARYSEATIENTNFSYLSEILFEPGSNTGIERYKVTSTVEEIVNPVTGELKLEILIITYIQYFLESIIHLISIQI